MAWEDFLNHRCDIYHLADARGAGVFGVKAAPRLVPEKEPSEKGVRCHFHLRQHDLLRLAQNEPETSVEGEVKCSIEIGTDIRENDTVYSHEDGLRYRAGVPRTVAHDHHIVVTLYREDGVKGAI